jgi:hypothetical protein
MLTKPRQFVLPNIHATSGDPQHLMFECFVFCCDAYLFLGHYPRGLFPTATSPIVISLPLQTPRQTPHSATPFQKTSST